jgi:hypothetical protein
MIIKPFTLRDLNIDTMTYIQDVDYPAYQLSTNEELKLTRFVVIHSYDTDTIRFIVEGNYKSKKKDENFSFCVEEMHKRDYKSSHIQLVFFKNRETIKSLIQAYFNGYIQVKDESDEVLEAIVVEGLIEHDFDDSFVEEEVVYESSVVKAEVVTEPIIIIDKAAPRPKPPAKKAKKKPAKKVVKKTTKTEGE